MAQQTQGGPPPQVSAPVETEAQRLAYECCLTATDAGRAAACLDRLVHTFAASSLAAPDQLALQLGRFPLSLLHDAIKSFGFERAACLIERDDLVGLVRRICIAEYLFREDTPFLTLTELAAHTRRFADFLREHRNFLVQTGLPPRCFRSDRWLYLHLGRLYDTRATVAPYPHGELFTHDGANPDAQPYKWVRTAIHSKIEECQYEQADLLNGMRPADAARIEKDRDRVFDIKLNIVELVANAAERARADSRLWDSVLGVLTKAFNATDVEFFFRMDRFYIGADAIHGLDDDLNPKMTPGGLTNLLEVVGHVEAELTHRVLDSVKQAIPGPLLQLLDEESGDHRWCYFSILDHPDRHAFDQAVDAMTANSDALGTFWRSYRDRLRQALQENFRVLVSVEMMPRHAGTLGPLVQDYANHVQKLREEGNLVIAPQGRNIFRKDGDSWTIQFNGKLMGKPHADGLFYIAQLLRRSDRPLTASELRTQYIAWKKDPKAPLRSAAADVLPAPTHEEPEADAEVLQLQADNLGEVIDKETMAAWERAKKERQLRA